MGSDYPLTRSSMINSGSSHVQTGVVRVEEEGEQLGKVFALSDWSISTWWRGTVALAQPMASPYESQVASTRNRGFRPLCEPAGGVWRWRWWRRLWRRWRSDHDSYDRHNHHRHNYDKYVRHDNYDNVGRSAGAVKHPAQGNRSACPGLDRRGERVPCQAMFALLRICRGDGRGCGGSARRCGGGSCWPTRCGWGWSVPSRVKERSALHWASMRLSQEALVGT
jgi:hypothetical protein